MVGMSKVTMMTLMMILEEDEEVEEGEKEDGVDDFNDDLEEEVEEGSLGWREVPPASSHSLFLLHCAMNTANTTQAEWQIFFNKHCKRLSCPKKTYFLLHFKYKT